MTKVYAVVLRWGTEDEDGVDIVAVYRRKSDARKALDQKAEEMMVEEPHKYDTTDYVAGEYFSTYDNGWYTNGYDTLYIIRTELHG